MTRQSGQGSNPRSSKSAFTLIELLVVVAIIALLVAILLPSLSSARAHAKTAVCGANLHSVGLSTANYLYGSKGVYPASYAYPHNKDGDWDATKQPVSKDFGYMHWSYFMYDGGTTGEKAFQCPAMTNGGAAPRTNPGRLPADWEPDQKNDKAQDAKESETLQPEFKDMQAPRIAFTANAAIMPRNKFTMAMQEGKPRLNRFVRESQVTRLAGTILLAEFLDNWKALGIRVDGGIVSKAHRPVNPFWHQGTAYDEYAAPLNSPGFQYGETSDQDTYGLWLTSALRDKENILDYTSGVPQINALGRHHPNPNTSYARKYGGLTDFLFGDGHVETLTIMDTMERRLWGDAYYSLTGENKIVNMTKIDTK